MVCQRRPEVRYLIAYLENDVQMLLTVKLLGALLQRVELSVPFFCGSCVGVDDIPRIWIIL